MKIVLEARFPKYIYHQICDPVHSTLLAVQVLEELGSKQALNSLDKSTQNGFDYIWDHPRNYDPGVNEELLAKWQQNPTARAQENLTRQSQDSVIRNYDSTDTRNCRQYVCKACMLLSSMRIFLEKDRNLISQRHFFWLLKIERRAILFYMHFHMTMLVGNVANRSGLCIFKSYVLQMYVVEHKQALKLFQRTFQQYCVTSLVYHSCWFTFCVLRSLGFRVGGRKDVTSLSTPQMVQPSSPPKVSQTSVRPNLRRI